MQTTQLSAGDPATAGARRRLPLHQMRSLPLALWPLCLLIPASLWLIFGHLDFALADRWYALQGGSWALRHHPLAEQLIHQGGRLASLLAWLGVLLALLSASSRLDARWRRPLRYLAAAVLLSVSVVSLTKYSLTSDCPWDMQAYGGKQATLGVLDARPTGMPAGHCFPAGHASAGYAWIALYFALAAAGVSTRQRRLALLGALALGLLFGFTQQLRGAHLLSHDLWTLALCWWSALALRPMLAPAAGAQQ